MGISRHVQCFGKTLAVRSRLMSLLVISCVVWNLHTHHTMMMIISCVADQSLMFWSENRWRSVAIQIRQAPISSCPLMTTVFPFCCSFWAGGKGSRGQRKNVNVPFPNSSNRFTISNTWYEKMTPDKKQILLLREAQNQNMQQQLPKILLRLKHCNFWAKIIQLKMILETKKKQILGRSFFSHDLNF